MITRQAKACITLLLTTLIFFASACEENTRQPAQKIVASDSTRLINSFTRRAVSLCPAAAQYARKHAMNDRYFFFIDLSAHSGLKRFAVVDIAQSKIVARGLVAHGAGNRHFADTAQFSNKPNSYCSSLGRYKVGEKYPGRFGSAYKLYGLDTTNSNAYARTVVLHAYDCVTDTPVFPLYSCNSLGCPMVSYRFLKILSTYIDQSEKPLLLWIVGH